jgi:signal peptidase I
MMTLFRRWTFRDRKKEKQKWEKPIYFMVITAFLFALITLVLFVPLTVKTGSMSPSIPKDGRIIVSPVLFGKTIWNNTLFPEFTQPQRGDVVLMTPPYYLPDSGIIRLINPFVRFITFQQFSLSSWKRQPWENRLMVKRIIALPGDSIKIENFQAYVKTPGNDFYLSEFEMSRQKYDILSEPLPEGWDEAMILSGTMDERRLGDDEYFVLGDNRSHSSDSRYWGAVGRKSFIGRAVFMYWPFNRFGKI